MEKEHEINMNGQSEIVVDELQNGTIYKLCAYIRIVDGEYFFHRRAESLKSAISITSEPLKDQTENTEILTFLVWLGISDHTLHFLK